MPYNLLSVYAATAEEVLYGYGPLGVGVVALAGLGWKFINILLTDRDKATSDKDAMVADLMDKVLPTLLRNTEVLESRTDLDRQLVEVLKANTKAFDEITYILKHGSSQHRAGGE